MSRTGNSDDHCTVIFDIGLREVHQSLSLLSIQSYRLEQLYRHVWYAWQRYGAGWPDRADCCCVQCYGDEVSRYLNLSVHQLSALISISTQKVKGDWCYSWWFQSTLLLSVIYIESWILRETGAVRPTGIPRLMLDWRNLRFECVSYSVYWNVCIWPDKIDCSSTEWLLVTVTRTLLMYPSHSCFNGAKSRSVEFRC